MIKHAILAVVLLVWWTDASAQEAPRSCTGFDFSADVVPETMSAAGPLTIARVTEGGPAAEVGMRVGDRILEINGVDVTKIPYPGTQLRGEPGSTRKLLMQRNDSTFIVEHVTGAVINDEAGTPRCRPTGRTREGGPARR